MDWGKVENWKLIVCFVSYLLVWQSLGDEIVCDNISRLASPQSWHSLSYGRFQVSDIVCCGSFFSLRKFLFFNTCLFSFFTFLEGRWSFALIQICSSYGKGSPKKLGKLPNEERYLIPQLRLKLRLWEISFKSFWRYVWLVKFVVICHFCKSRSDNFCW